MEIKQVFSKNRLFQPVDIAILVYFRIIFGAIMVYEVFRYFETDWIGQYFIYPPFNFTYYGFEWVQPLPGLGMYYLFFVMGVLGVCIAIGFKYRIVTILFFLAFTYMFLLEQTRYLNHFYLISLISFILIFLPANRALSIDAWRNPKIRSDDVPYWSLWILRFQLGVAYFYGGIAKLNWDWLNGEPLRGWLAERTWFPYIGPYFTEEWFVYMFTYSALFIDLLIVPFLLWRKTRWIAYGFALAFHLLNSQLFHIGIFPWFMILATLIFFEPNWPRFNYWKRSKKEPTSYWSYQRTGLSKNQKIILVMLLIFVIVQLGVPLRHYAYPGNVSWTEEGHIFSWHMKLRDKEYQDIFVFVTNPKTGEVHSVDLSFDLHSRQISKMAQNPDMILQYVHYLEDKLIREGIFEEDVEIRVESWVSLNGREPQLLVDPRVDLSKIEPTLLPKPWIVPLRDG